MSDPAPSPDRELYADFLRAFSLAVVVLGHWLELITSHLKPLQRWTEWLTWGFQVLPIFFVIGGALNAASWQRSQARGEAWAVWIRRRSQRLLVPLFPLVALWVLLVPLLRFFAFPPDFIRAAALTAVVPTWFLGAYLIVVVFVPLTWPLHRKYGARVMLVLIALIALLDLAGRSGIPLVADLNVLLVWGALHQFGYFWHDDKLPHHANSGIAWALVSIGALVALVFAAHYPVSMVVVDTSEPNNAAPPTLALFTLGLAQVGVALAVRRPIARWMERPRAQRIVGTVGSLTMTVFLWHMTAILLVAALAWATGNWPEAPDIDGSRWAVKPFWLALIGVVLTLLVWVFRRVERLPTREHAHPSRRRALAGVIASLWAITWIGLHGLDPADAPLIVTAGAVAILFVGMWTLDALPLPGRASRATKATKS